MISGDTSFGPPAAAGRETTALFGQTMGLVAAVAGFFTLGAYLGRTYESFERI